MFSFSKLSAVRLCVQNALTNRFLCPSVTVHQNQQTAGIKSIESRIGLPARPKRPLVPFMRFYKSIRSDLQKEHPDCNIQDMARLAAEQWRAADSKTKQKFMFEFREEQGEFLTRMVEYHKNFTEEQREQVRQMKLLLKEKKQVRDRRKKAKELGRPKHPIPAFTQYLTEQVNAVRGKEDIEFRGLAAKFGAQWRGMAASEKEKYLAGYRNALVDYKKEVDLWEEKMIEAGNLDLVRRKSLVETDPGQKRRLTTRTPRAFKINSVDVPADQDTSVTTKPVTKVSASEDKDEEPHPPPTPQKGYKKFLKFF